MIGAVDFDRRNVALLLTVAVAALGIGVIAAATTPVLPAAALIGFAVASVIWWRPIVGLFLFVAVVATVPFGVIPIPLGGAQLTFVDAIFLTTFSAVLARVLFDRWHLPVGAPGTALIAFVLVATIAFIAGGVSSPIPPELYRRFGKLLASLLFFLVARALLTSQGRLVTLTRWLMIGGAIQGAIGASLMAFSPLTQLTILTRLQAIGYPSTEVLRYVPGPNNTYTDQLRAIGTSVDPNVFGGTLMLALALLVVQWAAPRPVLPRPALLLLAVPTAAGLLLSLSRASWLGLAAGLLLVGTLRYRRILLAGVVVGLLLLVTPQGLDFVARFVSGFSVADRATAFRVGEYSNALTLIQRYPLLGIGFGLSPDIDVTAGVSSVYLLVAEQTGLLGLLAFVSAAAITWWTGARGLVREPDQALQGIRAAYLAALSGALVAGLLDHYFANHAFPHAVALFWLYAAGLVVAVELGGAPVRQHKPERAAQVRAAARRAHRAPV
ncbi:MAG TPA: O-antigen ligase family protein [Chloroflexota bacterium]